MSHVFQIPDDLYSEVAAYAAQRGQTPDALLMALVTGGSGTTEASRVDRTHRRDAI